MSRPTGPYQHEPSGSETLGSSFRPCVLQLEWERTCLSAAIWETHGGDWWAATGKERCSLTQSTFHNGHIHLHVLFLGASQPRFNIRFFILFLKQPPGVSQRQLDRHVSSVVPQPRVIDELPKKSQRLAWLGQQIHTLGLQPTLAPS